ncbi:hypothetical protein, partial [Enterovibrio norvegicus]|uniref:hypothetical protein n=1 Tax=Enterovibrio norvegicus TaxID=188144 RepID=UPI001A7E1A08
EIARLREKDEITGDVNQPFLIHFSSLSQGQFTQINPWLFEPTTPSQPPPWKVGGEKSRA